MRAFLCVARLPLFSEGRVLKYFVTGTTGFVGGNVARQLVEARHEVVAVVRNPAKAGDLKNLGVQIYQGDVTEKESMRGPMTGVDGVFHIAGWYKIGVKDKSEGAKINIGGTRRRGGNGAMTRAHWRRG